MVLSRGQRVHRPGAAGALPGGPAAPTASFAMTQLAAAYRPYQRSTSTGGGQGKGAGTIPVTISSATAGTIHARTRRVSDSSVMQAEWVAATVAGGATVANVAGVDASAEWVYLDLKGSDGAWKLGTVPVGMGAVLAMAGQSLAVNTFLKAGDPSTTIAAVGGTINPGGRVLASYTGSSNSATATNWTSVTDVANANGVYNSAGAAELLNLMATKLGVVCGLIGHAVNATALATWLPGQPNHTELARVITLAGGAFEAFWWFQGHSDAGDAGGSAVWGWHNYRAKLDTLFTDLAGRSSVPFAKYLTAIPNINSASWGDFLKREQIRRAQRDWCADNGATYIGFSDISLNADIVHQVQAGAQRIAQHVVRAMTNGDGGPRITAVTKSGLDLVCTVQHGAGASALVTAGTPATRMLVTAADNAAGTALALDAVTPITVGASTITLKLASDPGDVPLEVWPMAAHPVADGSASGIWDNSSDGDGIALGRQLRFDAAPVLRKRSGALSTAGVSFAAGKFGNGRSAGEMISGGPLLTDIPYSGRTLEAFVTLTALPGASQVIAWQNGLIGLWLNGANLFYAWGTTNASVAHGLTADGQPHHFRLVIEPGNQRRRVLVDGNLLATNTTAIGTRTLTNPFVIGGGGAGNFLFTSGTIDEVALWNRALTPAECAVVPSAAYTGTETGLQHLWHLNGDGVDSAA